MVLTTEKVVQKALCLSGRNGQHAEAEIDHIDGPADSANGIAQAHSLSDAVIVPLLLIFAALKSFW